MKTEIEGIKIYNHPNFCEELKEFINKHCPSADLEQTMDTAMNLIFQKAFKNIECITRKNFGKADNFEGYPVYFLKLMLTGGGLEKSQNPKSYLILDIVNKYMGFLCLDSHIQNYKDSELRKMAKKRTKELLEYIHEIDYK